jgi:AmmeMemoRadiSam system protein B
MTGSPDVTDVRPSPIAGTWYPGAVSRLAAEVDGYLAAAQVEPINGQIIGLMAPHAGYRYSGPVAGHAFRLVQGMKVETVAVISPIHRPVSPAPAFTTAHQAYQTPLGQVLVNHQALDAIGAGGVTVEALRHDSEHSLEIELPFLQRALAGEFALIPVMLSDQSAAYAKKVGHALAEVLRPKGVGNTLLVASTDLSHFYDQEIAKRLDRVFLERVADFDPEGVIAVEEQGQGFACGRGAVAAVMWAARDLGADTAAVVNHATSGDATGDYRSVVGYGAAVFYKRAAGERSTSSL